MIKQTSPDFLSKLKLTGLRRKHYFINLTYGQYQIICSLGLKNN